MRTPMPDAERPPPTRASRRAIIFGLLVSWTALTFAPALQGAFIWDDLDLIANNPCIKDGRYLLRNLRSSFWNVCNYGDDERSSLTNRYYRPLVTLSFMADYALWRVDPRGYHLSNVLLHLIASSLACWFALQSGARSTWAALGATLLFALHPTRAESVSWISGRTDSLMAVFFFASLCCFCALLQRRETGSHPIGGRRRIALSVGAWASFCASVLCKEMGLALALVLPALDRLILNRDDPEQWRRNVRRHHMPLSVLSALYVLAWVLAQPAHAAPARADGLAARLVTIFETLGHYIEMLIQPYQPSAQIGAFFQPATPSWMRMTLGALALTGTCAGIVALRRRLPGASWGLLVFGVTLAPVSNLVPHGLYYLAAERFAYLPFWGLGFAACAAIDSRSPALRRLLFGLLGTLALSWSVTTFVRSFDYGSELRFWRATAATSPNNPFVQENLALALLQRGQLGAAERRFARAFEQAKRLKLRDRQLSVQLGKLRLLLLRTADTRPRELARIRRFLEALLAALERPGHPAAGPLSLELEGLRLAVAPALPEVQRELRKSARLIFELLGQTNSALGNDAQALHQLGRAQRMAPSSASTLLNLTLALARAQQLERARAALAGARETGLEGPVVEEVGRALDLAAPRIARLRELSDRTAGKADATRATEHQLRAELFVLLKARGRAIDQLQKLVELRPTDRTARAMLALTLASVGEIGDAKRVLARAREELGEDQGLRELEREVLRVYKEWRSQL